GERFARRLVDATFADLVFFANSGAEANEAAVKMARRRHSIDGRPERYRTLTFEGAFHGRTLAMIAAGGQAKYLDGFGPKVDGFEQIPLTDLAAVEAAIGPGTGSIMIEPIQGEGGVRLVPPAFLGGLREICDRHGLLLIFDEVQTGVGRTGRFYAYEHCGIHPDILTSAKGIGGGYPLAMAVGNATLDVILAPGFLERVARLGLDMRQRLAELKDRHGAVIDEIRGEGLLIGLRLKVPPASFAEETLKQKLLVIPAGDNVVRIVPPLVVTDEELAEGVRRLDAACAAVEERLMVAMN